MTTTLHTQFGPETSGKFFKIHKMKLIQNYFPERTATVHFLPRNSKGLQIVLLHSKRRCM